MSHFLLEDSTSGRSRREPSLPRCAWFYDQAGCMIPSDLSLYRLLCFLPVLVSLDTEGSEPNFRHLEDTLLMEEMVWGRDS